MTGFPGAVAVIRDFAWFWTQAAGCALVVVLGLVVAAWLLERGERRGE